MDIRKFSLQRFEITSIDAPSIHNTNGPIIVSKPNLFITNLDLLRREEVPIGFQFTRLNLLIVDEDLVSVVRFHDQSVQMGVNVVLAADVLLDQMVLSFVAEDNVNLGQEYTIMLTIKNVSYTRELHP